MRSAAGIGVGASVRIAKRDIQIVIQIVPQERKFGETVGMRNIIKSQLRLRIMGLLSATSQASKLVEVVNGLCCSMDASISSVRAFMAA